MRKPEIEYPIDGYPDANNNGVPDVFENRLPISEVLNLPEKLEQVVQVNTKLQQQVDADNTIVLELDARLRAPKRGEMYIFLNQIQIASYGGGSPSFIVKRIISAPSWWKPEKR